jgi:hypothetical protein
MSGTRRCQAYDDATVRMSSTRRCQRSGGAAGVKARVSSVVSVCRPPLWKTAPLILLHCLWYQTYNEAPLACKRSRQVGDSGAPSYNNHYEVIKHPSGGGGYHFRIL